MDINHIADRINHFERLLFLHHTMLFACALILFLVLLMRLVRVRSQSIHKPLKKTSPPSNFLQSYDVEGIAGDNPISTKLDLARAYIEMDKIHLAKNILYQVKKQGTPAQKNQAKRLLSSLATEMTH